MDGARTTDTLSVAWLKPKAPRRRGADSRRSCALGIGPKGSSKVNKEALLCIVLSGRVMAEASCRVVCHVSVKSVSAFGDSPSASPFESAGECGRAPRWPSAVVCHNDGKSWTRTPFAMFLKCCIHSAQCMSKNAGCILMFEVQCFEV